MSIISPSHRQPIAFDRGSYQFRLRFIQWAVRDVDHGNAELKTVVIKNKGCENRRICRLLAVGNFSQILVAHTQTDARENLGEIRPKYSLAGGESQEKLPDLLSYFWNGANFDKLRGAVGAEVG